MTEKNVGGDQREVSLFEAPEAAAGGRVFDPGRAHTDELGSVDRTEEVLRGQWYFSQDWFEALRRQMPHRAKPFLGKCLICFGVLIGAAGLTYPLITGFCLLTGADRPDYRWSRVAMFSIALGASNIVLGKRMRVAPASEVLRKDPRPPILYLRSFRDEGRGRPNIMPEDPFTVFAKSFEQKLADIVKPFGPFVAIGRPKKTPELGAARFYFDNNSWQCAVLELLKRSRLVILQAGSTEGLRWELVTAIQVLKPERLLIFLPFEDRQRGKRGHKRYAKFRRWANTCLPHPLPENIKDSLFLFFGPGWAPHLLPKGNSAPTPASLGHANAPMLAEFRSFHYEDVSIGAVVRAVLALAIALLYVVNRLHEATSERMSHELTLEQMPEIQSYLRRHDPMNEHMLHNLLTEPMSEIHSFFDERSPWRQRSWSLAPGGSWGDPYLFPPPLPPPPPGPR